MPARSNSDKKWPKKGKYDARSKRDKETGQNLQLEEKI